MTLYFTLGIRSKIRISPLVTPITLKKGFLLFNGVPEKAHIDMSLTCPRQWGVSFYNLLKSGFCFCPGKSPTKEGVVLKTARSLEVAVFWAM